ncbi:MAG: divalent metal cation transporter, partial [Planctomycetaceae bacterium]|nr:divalent metal cation transporter [Planctomycetaceae bacterium]
MSSEVAPGDTSPARKWYQAVGPGLITACVVIGPGSILSSSKVGAGQGYSMLWLIAVACIFMMIFMTLGAKLGVVLEKSIGQVITELAGKKLAVAIGLGVFVISTAYQSGNNLGVQSAF